MHEQLLLHWLITGHLINIHTKWSNACTGGALAWAPCNTNRSLQSTAPYVLKCVSLLTPPVHAHTHAQGYEWQCIWERIQHLIVKSLISVQPIIRNNYRSILPPDNDGFSCFEILGWAAI